MMLLLLAPGMPPHAVAQGPATPENHADAAEAAVDATELLQRADAIRFPREHFETRLTVTNYTADEAQEVREYKVMSRGNENTIVLTEEPASERGQALLMRGRDLWIFMPSVSQPVRLSLSQRLTGQVANGDLARANFAGDYTASLAGSETLDGEECWVLDLAASGRGVTYARVKYWVAKSTSRPMQAEFYAVSGRLLKTAQYTKFRELAGRERPTQLIIEDAVKTGNYSVLEYTTMKITDLPERMFTQQYLRRL
ncbi:MAG: outer membrane lipoprotein-sorting protein [Chromatocurvus sp.]